jgi:cellobiose phosphorylase
MNESTTRFGHFNETGTEFIVTNPDTPRAIDNFLWNETAFSNVQQTGVGYFDYQIGDKEAVQLFSGIGRACDFDVFGREHVMSRLVYLRDQDTGEYWNLNWEPVCRDADSFECVHGPGYTILRNSTAGIAAEFRIFIPPGNDPVELWTLSLRSVNGRARRLSIFVYCQIQFSFKWGFDSYGNHIYREVHFNTDLNAVIASKHPFRRPHDFLTAFLFSDTRIAGFDGSRTAFVGVYNTLANPVAVISGQCSNTPGSAEDTIAAVQFDVALNGQTSRQINLVLGATDGEAGAATLAERYLGRAGEYFSRLRNTGKRIQETHRVSTPDPVFDRMVNVWIKQGALFGAAWCRWGWNGYRDIVQHGLGVAALDPSRTRAILAEAFRHQYISGLALRGWNPVDKKPYSDSAVWLVFTLCAYLKETGDIAFLDQEIPFYDGGPATVLQHIRTALDFLENNKGAHGHILIKFGDWNDSLTNVGKEGRGESVWLSMACAEALREMADLMSFLGRQEDVVLYLLRRESLLSAINGPSWNGEWYVRCYDDNGRAVGSHENRFAKIFMEPQCWALIAGVADTTQREKILASCDRLLLTDLGYTLLAPPFTERDPSIGRISAMEPGIAENGTIYTHLNIWMILGLLRSGLGDRAYDLFQRITPSYVSGDNDPKQNASFMYANCYFGPDHKNRPFQQEFTWITGSYAWLNTVLANEMLGAKPGYRGLTLAPCLPTHWEECSIRRTWRNATYHITLRNPHKLQTGQIEATMDGQPIRDGLLPEMGDGRVHEVVATLQTS